MPAGKECIGIKFEVERFDNGAFKKSGALKNGDTEDLDW